MTTTTAATVLAGRAARLVRLDESGWSRGARSTLDRALVWLLAAWLLVALNRYGGQITTAPAALGGFVAIGVWGWLGSAAAVSAGVRLATGRWAPAWTALLVAAAAQRTLLPLAACILVFANFFRWLGPGLVVSAIVALAWMPAQVATGLRHHLGLGWRTVWTIAAVTQLVWLLVIGRWLESQIGHLL